MPLTDINISEKGNKPNRSYTIDYNIDGNNCDLILTESEMKIITPFLESKGFSGHIRLYNWLKTSKAAFFSEYVTDRDSNRIIVNTVRELKRIYGLLSDEIIADISEKLPHTMFARTLKAGNKGDVSIFQQELFNLAYGPNTNVSAELKDKASKLDTLYKTEIQKRIV